MRKICADTFSEAPPQILCENCAVHILHNLCTFFDAPAHVSHTFSGTKFAQFSQTRRMFLISASVQANNVSILYRKTTGSRPKTPPTKSYSKFLRRTQIRWVIWRSSNHALTAELTEYSQRRQNCLNHSQEKARNIPGQRIPLGPLGLHKSFPKNFLV